MCSKSSWLSTVRVPPRLPPSYVSLAGVFTPAATPMPLLARVALPLAPHAASTSAARAASAIGMIILSDIQVPPVLCDRPRDSSSDPWVESVPEPVAEQVERQHGEQQGESREGHVPPSG